MADPKDLWVTQAPKVVAKGEALAYTFDFSDVGAPSAIVVTLAYNAVGTDISTGTGGVLSGNATWAGNIVTFKKFTPLTAENHRLVCGVTISGNTVYSMLDVAVFDAAPDLSSVTVASSSYGTVAGVAGLVPKWRNKAGSFDTTTSPDLQNLVNWIDEVSSMVNAMLATEGFTTPITDGDVTPSLRSFVNGEVAAMVEGVHGSGRFGPTVANRRGGGGKSRYAIIMDDVKAFIQDFKVGLEQQGAARERDFASGIGYRDGDESGDDVTPLFQREAFGESYTDWDDA